MRDRYSLGSVLEDRFAWNVISMPSNQSERKTFDAACDVWDKYQRQKRLDRAAEPQPVGRRDRRHSQLISEASPAFVHLPTIPDTVTLRKGSVRPTMDFDEAHADVQQTRLHRSSSHKSARFGTSRTGRRTVSRSRSHTSLDRSTGWHEDAHPSRLLCRTLRVFVAWKA